MGYLITSNKTEMEKFYCDYSILSPGKYLNIYENGIFLYINEDLLDFIDDLFDKFIEDYDGCQYEYINEEQLNILEFELSKRISEINEDREINGVYLDFDENLNKRHYETINKNIREHKREISEALEKLLEWIKVNRGKGITLYGPMELKLIIDINELDTLFGFYEFLPGKFQNERCNDNSVFMYDSNIIIIEDLINKSFDKTSEQPDIWGVTYFDKNHSTILENVLLKRITQIKENREITGNYFPEILYESLNREIKIYKNDILKMLDELYIFIKANKENGITLLGPTSLSFLLLSSSASSASLRLCARDGG